MNNEQQNTIDFENKTWRIVDTKTADEVLATFPDKLVGEIMAGCDLDLLLLEAQDLTTKRVGVLLIHQREQIAVCRNHKTGEIIDMDKFMSGRPRN